MFAHPAFLSTFTKIVSTPGYLVKRLVSLLKIDSVVVSSGPLIIDIDIDLTWPTILTDTNL